MKRRLHIQANHSDTQTKTIFGMRNQIVIKINNEKKKKNKNLKQKKGNET